MATLLTGGEAHYDKAPSASQSLYVAYQASQTKLNATVLTVTGYVILSGWTPPNSSRDIADLCMKIAENENVDHVIPLFWSNLGRG